MCHLGYSIWCLHFVPLLPHCCHLLPQKIRTLLGSESLTDAAHKVKDFVNSEEVQNLSGQVKDLINSDEAQELVGQVGNMMSRASSWLTG